MSSDLSYGEESEGVSAYCPWYSMAPAAGLLLGARDWEALPQGAISFPQRRNMPPDLGQVVTRCLQCGAGEPVSPWDVARARLRRLGHLSPRMNGWKWCRWRSPIGHSFDWMGRGEAFWGWASKDNRAAG